VTEAAHHAAAHGEIDLDVVREMLSHFTYQDHQEAQELILSALQEINEHFGWVSLEAAELVAQHLGTTVNRVYGLLTFYADFRTQPRGKHFMLLCHGMSCYVMGSQKLVEELKDRFRSSTAASAFATGRRSSRSTTSFMAASRSRS